MAAGLGLHPLEIEEITKADFKQGIQSLFGPSVVHIERVNGVPPIKVNLATMVRVKLHYLHRILVEDAFRFSFEDPKKFGFRAERSLNDYS